MQDSVQVSIEQNTITQNALGIWVSKATVTIKDNQAIANSKGSGIFVSLVAYLSQSDNPTIVTKLEKCLGEGRGRPALSLFASLN